MGCFSDLRLGISKIQNYFFQYFGSDVVLDIFGIKVDDLEYEHSCMKIDLFLCAERYTFCSLGRSCRARMIRLA